MRSLMILVVSFQLLQLPVQAGEIVDLWEKFAPGETTQQRGVALPRRENEDPPATRITDITFPQMEIFRPEGRADHHACVVILPGGGYRYCVVDKEGSEIAEWLNSLGITAAVLKYRTKIADIKPDWARPVADAQRAIRVLRSQAEQRGIDPQKIGIMGFSAGGQAAALALVNVESKAEKSDSIDQLSSAPDFGLLIYPWNLYDAATDRLIPEIRITAQTPPVFLVHTHDDHSTALGSVYFYAALKREKVSAELHVFETGGHGYGMRPVAGSNIDRWPGLAAQWLMRRDLGVERVAD